MSDQYFADGYVDDGYTITKVDPPAAVTNPTVQTILKAYSYWEYNDDPDIVAFFTAFNSKAQEYLDAFNALNLPVYAGTNLTGALLDWVLDGLYGLTRPSLPSGVSSLLGSYGTAAYGRLSYGEMLYIPTTDSYTVTDDIFKRIATWNLYQGDGKTFTVRWLKRRIARFLFGANGTDLNDFDTSRISITFGIGNQINITITKWVRTITKGQYGSESYGRRSYNAVESVYTAYTPIALASVLKAAIDSGACELPFEFTYVVNA